MTARRNVVLGNPDAAPLLGHYIVFMRQRNGCPQLVWSSGRIVAFQAIGRGSTPRTSMFLFLLFVSQFTRFEIRTSFCSTTIPKASLSRHLRCRGFVTMDTEWFIIQHSMFTRKLSARLGVGRKASIRSQDRYPRVYCGLYRSILPLLQKALHVSNKVILTLRLKLQHRIVTLLPACLILWVEQRPPQVRHHREGIDFAL